MNADPYSDTDLFTNAYSDAGAYMDTYANTVEDADADAYTHADPYADADTDADVDADPHTYAIRMRMLMQCGSSCGSVYGHFADVDAYVDA